MARKGGAPQNLKPFKKGFDPNRNMKGRPKTLPSLEEALIEILGEEQDGKNALKMIINVLKTKAAKGDVRAAEVLLDRAFGKAKQSIDMNASVDVGQIFTIAGQNIKF